MFGDCGYMEEGELGKPYNFKLLNRLARYTLPYKKTIATALFLTILITAFDLAFPYFSKIAIDRYILSSWYLIDTSKLKASEAQQLFSRYGHLLDKSRDGSYCAISHVDLKKMDPADLFVYKSRQILTLKRFYRTSVASSQKTLADMPVRSIHRMDDNSFLVAYERLNSLSKEKILKIRVGDIRGVALVGGLFFVLLILSFGLSYGQYYLLEFTGQHVMQDIRLKLFDRMQSQAVSFFDRNPVGRLVTRVTNDIENLNEMFKSVLMTLFKDLFLLAGILVVLLCLNWRLALVSFTLLPLIFGLTLLFSTMAREIFREIRATVAKINAFLQERITGMRVVQLFARENFQMEAFSRINHENYLAGMKQIRIFAVFMPVMELLSSFAVALIIWYGGGKVVEEQLTLGSLVAFISYIQMFFKPIRDISEKYNIMQSAMASTERIFEFMDHKEEIPEPKTPLIPSKIEGRLTFRQVSFSYEKGNPVIRNVSFEVKPGETVAIVGPTGAGKTTLANLIQRFYDPNEGSILLDGIDLKKWPKKELRKQMSLCMQDVFIFAGNLEENISLGHKDMNSHAIKKAAEDANALPFIERLADGLQQELGEGGASLSTGEQQLLSFARALAPDPRLLILDEATSSVDPETERRIRKAISHIAAERTTVVIAHRLSTIKNADRILVLHHGRIVEQGTHEDLLALQGIYYRLNKLREE